MPPNDVKLHISSPTRDVAGVLKRKTSTSRVTLSTSCHKHVKEERIEFFFVCLFVLLLLFFQAVRALAVRPGAN